MGKTVLFLLRRLVLLLTGGFCWPGKSGLTGHVTRLLTGPGTCGMCPWCPRSLGRRDTSGVGSAAVPYQHTAALCGFRDGNARLAVPGGASSGIPPIFLASDGFGCPSFRLRCVPFSSLLNNHRKGNSILSVLPHLSCPHVSLAFCPPLPCRSSRAQMKTPPQTVGIRKSLKSLAQGKEQLWGFVYPLLCWHLLAVVQH